jgi:hypothetical protein
VNARRIAAAQTPDDMRKSRSVLAPVEPPVEPTPQKAA